MYIIRKKRSKSESWWDCTQILLKIPRMSKNESLHHFCRRRQFILHSNIQCTHEILDVQVQYLDIHVPIEHSNQWPHCKASKGHTHSNAAGWQFSLSLSLSLSLSVSLQKSDLTGIPVPFDDFQLFDKSEPLYMNSVRLCYKRPDLESNIAGFLKPFGASVSGHNILFEYLFGVTHICMYAGEREIMYERSL